MHEGRSRQLRITDLASYPKRAIAKVVAAEYLEIDIRTLDALIDTGQLIAIPHGKTGTRVTRDSLIAYEAERHRASTWKQQPHS